MSRRVEDGMSVRMVAAGRRSKRATVAGTEGGDISAAGDCSLRHRTSRIGNSYTRLKKCGLIAAKTTQTPHAHAGTTFG
jgi:hypothetical protein